MDGFVIPLEHLGRDQAHIVGGKNASLGEMLGALSGLGLRVPGGFATTTAAYRAFLRQEELDRRIAAAIDDLDTEDVGALADTGTRIRNWMLSTPLPARLEDEVTAAVRSMAGGGEIAVAVRSSATAEDLPEASFAGQQETFLNVRGERAILTAMREVFASLYNDRAISYRVHKGFNHSQVALSAGVQHMVRSDIGTSGVMFTLDTDSGFRDVVLVTASYGLGETIVQGAVNPDEFYLYKPALRAGRPAVLRRNLGTKAIRMEYADDGAGERVRTVEVPAAERARFALDDIDLATLGRQALLIEQHYGVPMDIEWAKDGSSGQLFILQARPETVHSRSRRSVQRFALKARSKILATGRSVGQRIGAGTTRIVGDIKAMAAVQPGDVLVTDMTDPDWEPVMKRAAAIVTNRGGRTCHAAIIARELGIPAVVGCGDATRALTDGMPVTVSCADGEAGFVYEGVLEYDSHSVELGAMPASPVRIMMNIANPDRAFGFAMLPHRGVGLARLEFIINRMIGVHPRAVLEFARQPPDIQASIVQCMAGYTDPVEFYVSRLAEGIAQIAAAFAPEPVIVRLSDFKSNEYANLVGGRQYEPHEENPMLGFRGAARYLDPAFQPCFDLECRALRHARETMGLSNIWIMVPFVRTPSEANQVIRLLASNGLERGRDGLRVMMMCELPTNALLADRFLQFFDGMSLGSNDMTQLTLGLDRDSGTVASQFDERDDAVKRLLSMAITACRKAGKYIGICGQGPSDHPELARWLVDQGIDSISLNPDAVVSTWMRLARG
jgi:pyruvate,water dikinase